MAVSGMVGRTYLLRGRPVTVLASGGGRSRGGLPLYGGKPCRSPRNVLIEHADGRRAVRPARGLRRTEGSRA